MTDILQIGKEPSDSLIVVAMSGGVDSAVTAAIIKQAGYNVIGITLRLYDSSAQPRQGACCAGQDIADARLAAATLKIPHYVFDYKDIFHKKVIEPFAEAYANGETPVPCVACNQSIKFNDLLQAARELEADGLATGHYVRTVVGKFGPEMYRAADPERDQSYFLSGTTIEQLRYLRFPLGNIHKVEVRRLAEAAGLHLAKKRDSQDICFATKHHHSEIVAKLQPGAAKKGEIAHIDGRILGEHNGIANFTIGQRKGLGIGGLTEPLYVLHIDAKKSQVVVGPYKELEVTKIRLRNVNWLLNESEINSQINNLWVRLRSTANLRKAKVTIEGSHAYVQLLEPEFGVALGQIAVFYDKPAIDARVLGGGTIEAVVKNNTNQNFLARSA